MCATPLGHVREWQLDVAHSSIRDCQASLHPTISAIGLRQAERRWSDRFEGILRRAPYVSAGLILVVGLAIGDQGWSALAAGFLLLGGLVAHGRAG